MIDILLTTYNGQRFLKEQIESILSQTCNDWQLIIRDDVSEDDTLKIIKIYISRYHDKIKLIEDSLGNLGPTQNFNKLLEKSKNEYIMFCDQDDIWLPEKTEITLNKMKEAENIYPNIPILVHTDLKIVDSDLNVLSDSFWSQKKIDPIRGSNLNKIIYKNVVTGCTTMINKKAKQIAFPIPPKARMHDWWIAMIIAKQGKIFCIQNPTVLYRQHEKNIIGAKSKKMTISLFYQKLSKFLRQFFKDYNTIKKVYPKANIFFLLLHNIRNTTKNRLYK